MPSETVKGSMLFLTAPPLVLLQVHAVPVMAPLPVADSGASGQKKKAC